MASGELKKMLIVGYPDDKFTSGKETGQYEVLINPDSYALTYEIIKTDKSGDGKPSGSPTYSRTPSQTISFKFLFDGTGVIQASTPGGGPDVTPSILGQSKNKRDVTADLAAFSKIVYAFNSDTHQPGYVQLRWGTLYYNCCLQRMTITMKLFAPDGTPLRAEADCTFTSVVDQQTQVAATDPKSPDLSHVRTVKKGDTLPLLCYNEYGDSKYYYQVAKYNGLTDFKILTPGTKLIFPPFAK